MSRGKEIAFLQAGDVAGDIGTSNWLHLHCSPAAMASCNKATGAPLKKLPASAWASACDTCAAGFLTGAPRNAFVGAISNSEVLKITRAQMTALQVFLSPSFFSSIASLCSLSNVPNRYADAPSARSRTPRFKRTSVNPSLNICLTLITTRWRYWTLSTGTSAISSLTARL